MGSGLPLDQCGIKVLGAPLGTAEFVTAHTDERLATEQKFLRLLPRLLGGPCGLGVALCAANQVF